MKELVLTAAKIKRLANKIQALPPFTDDRYGGIDTIAKQLISPTVVMLELGDEDGLLIAEDVGKDAYVIAHIIVFNRRRLPHLEAQLDGTLQWFFATFSPAYVAAWIPSRNVAAISLMKRLGWNLDGIIRGLMLYYGKRTDAYIYSISREELENGRVI